MGQPDKREKILQGAVKVFATHGFYNSKVSQIASAAGVADGTIYLYFKSKDDILIQLFTATMAEIIERQETALRGIEAPIARLRVFMEVHFQAISESAALAEVLTVELRSSSKFMRGADMHLFGRYLSIIARIVADGQEAGVFTSEANPRLVARMLFGAMDELALQWAMDERRDEAAEACRQTVGVFLDGLTKREWSQ